MNSIVNLLIKSSRLLVVNRFFDTEDIPFNSCEILKRTSKQDAVFVDRGTIAHDEGVRMTNISCWHVRSLNLYEYHTFLNIRISNVRIKNLLKNFVITWSVRSKSVYVTGERLITYNHIFDAKILTVSTVLQFVIINSNIVYSVEISSS